MKKKMGSVSECVSECGASTRERGNAKYSVTDRNLTTNFVATSDDKDRTDLSELKKQHVGTLEKSGKRGETRELGISLRTNLGEQTRQVAIRVRPGDDVHHLVGLEQRRLQPLGHATEHADDGQRLQLMRRRR